MLSTPFSRLNISCTCTECSSFIRPYPTRVPLIHPPPGLAFDLASILSSGATTPPTSRLAPTALAPSPNFLSTRRTPRKLKREVKLSHLLPAPQAPLEHYLQRVTLASRTLWAGLSSPVDEALPLSAKTPGLKRCAGAGCTVKVLPGFGRAVCGECVGVLRNAVGEVVGGSEEGFDDLGALVDGRMGCVGGFLCAAGPSLKSGSENQSGLGSLAVDDDVVVLPSAPFADSWSTNTLPSLTTTTATHAPPLSLPLSPPVTPREAMTPSIEYAVHFPALPERGSRGSSSSSIGSSGRGESSVSRPWSQSSSSSNRSSSSGGAWDCSPLQLSR